jgi:hypothetical protein
MESNSLAELKCESVKQLADAVFAQKEHRRQMLAALPVEEKYRQFLRLQRMVFDTLRAAGKDCPGPWPVPDS